ncbi:MAG: hypothetical protein Q7S47_02480 [bacterium]|nr:hypothetical protein [bacterium]
MPEPSFSVDAFPYEDTYRNIEKLNTFTRENWDSGSLLDRYQSLSELSSIWRTHPFPHPTDHSRLSPETKKELFSSMLRTYLGNSFSEMPSKHKLFLIDEVLSLFEEIRSSHLSQGAKEEDHYAHALPAFESLDDLIAIIRAQWNELSRHDRIRILDVFINQARLEGVISKEKLNNTAEFGSSTTAVLDFEAYLDMMFSKQWSLRKENFKVQYIDLIARGHHYCRTRELSQKSDNFTPPSVSPKDAS